MSQADLQIAPADTTTPAWRQMVTAAKGMVAAKKSRSFSSERTTIRFPNQKTPLRIICISDWHSGSYGTDYEKWVALTDLIIREKLHVICVGDMLQMSIKLRGVLEVMDNVLPPSMQMDYLESWTKEVGGVFTGQTNGSAHYHPSDFEVTGDKGGLIASTWDNHSVMRTENATGTNEYGKIFSAHCPYFNAIGHLDLVVGDAEMYKLAISHQFRGRSMYNPTHSQMRYARMEANDREIIIAGDSHVPGLSMLKEGGLTRLGINCGNLQPQSGYGKRFFSLEANPEMPCFVLDPHQHNFVPFWSVENMLDATGRIGN